MRYQIHDFYCTYCGKKGYEIPRPDKKKREKGHLKKLYCPWCKREVNFAEISLGYTLEDFMYEFRAGNFNEEGMREATLKQCLSEREAD